MHLSQLLKSMRRLNYRRESINCLRRISLIVFLIAFTTSTSAEDYWPKLQKKAEEIYGGWDVTVAVNTGVEHREYFQGTHTGPYGNFEIIVPLYSKKERIANGQAKTEFLQKGAELIKVIEERTERVEILKKKAQVLKAVMMDEGSSGIKAYYDVAEDMAKLEAEIREAKKKLEAMLR